MSDFSSQPVGSAVQPCPLCQAAWDKVNGEVKKIDSMTDVRARNKAISASYARLYQADPDLKWAGAAAFASKQVGCGMDETGATISGAKSSLGKGNLAVYDELYPALRFYQENKGTMSNDQIMACLDQKPPPKLDPSIKQGIQETMDGDPDGGAMTMLKHEQQDTLQQSVYDSTMFRRMLDINQMTGWAPITYVVSSSCTSTDPNQVVKFSDYPGDLYNFDQRWPFASACANKFVQLSDNPATAPGVQKALTEISNASPP